MKRQCVKLLYWSCGCWRPIENGRVERWKCLSPWRHHWATVLNLEPFISKLLIYWASVSPHGLSHLWFTFFCYFWLTAFWQTFPPTSCLSGRVCNRGKRTWRAWNQTQTSLIHLPVGNGWFVLRQPSEVLLDLDTQPPVILAWWWNSIAYNLICFPFTSLHLT